MVKLLCLVCGQVWYSAYAGGNCDYCKGKLVEADNELTQPPVTSNVVSLPAKRAVRKLTKWL